MRLMDLLGLAIKNLFRHKIRTLLTVLGVSIGGVAIIVMISLGLAMNKNFEAQVSQMGSLTTIQIYSYGDMGGKAGTKMPKLDDAAIQKFNRMEGVEGATPIMDFQLKLKAGKYVSYAQIMGMDIKVLDKLGIKLQSGNMLTGTETYGMLVGSQMIQNFQDPRSTRWQPAPADFDLTKEKVTLSVDMTYGDKPQPGVKAPKYKYKPQNATIVGMMAQGGQYDYAAIMSLDAVRALKKEQDLFNKKNSSGSGSGSGSNVISSGGYMSSGGTTKQTGYNQAIIKVKDIKSVEKVLKVLTDEGYQANSPVQYLEEMKKQAAGLQQILGGIGAMALLIAAIGIMNTMYMSIYERTREIGIIKVIGARLRDIHRLFMVEAAWIGIFGGVCSIVLSIGASILLNNSSLNLGGSNMMYNPDGTQTKMPLSYIPLWLLGAAFAFSIVTSLAAGFLPSRRAMKLSVMKALRQD